MQRCTVRQTVSDIYEKLQRNKYIQVCSTSNAWIHLWFEVLQPGRKQLYPNISTRQYWKPSPTQRWFEFLSGNIGKTCPVTIRDRGCFLGGISGLDQFSWLTRPRRRICDPDFWLKLKGIKSEWPFHVVTFASCWRAGRNIIDPLTPFYLSPLESVSFVAIDHDDQIGVRLFTKAELNALLDKVFADHHFDESMSRF